MALTVSAPVRIAAICGLVFTVIVFGGLRMLGGSGGGSDSAVESKVIKHHPFGPGVKTTTHKTTTTPAKHTSKPAVKKAPVVHRPTIDVAAIKAARAAGLPEPL